MRFWTKAWLAIKLGVPFIVALMCGYATAQTTVISSTGVVDSDGITRANGTWSLAFKPSPSYPNIGIYNQNGTPLTTCVTTTCKGALSGTGTFSTTVYDNTTITPGGSQWVLNICPNAASACAIFTFQAVGSTLNLTASINAVLTAPRFSATAGAYGYADVEAVNSIPVGGTYYNVSALCQRTFNGTVWSCPSAGSVLPSNAQLLGTVGTNGQAVSTGSGNWISPGYYLNSPSASSALNGIEGTGDSICAGTGQVTPTATGWPYLWANSVAGGQITNNCYGGTNEQASTWYEYTKQNSFPTTIGNPIHFNAGGRNNTSYSSALTAPQLLGVTLTTAAHALSTAVSAENIQPFSNAFAGTPVLSTGNVTSVTMTSSPWAAAAPSCAFVGGTPSSTTNTCSTYFTISIPNQYLGLGYSGAGTCSINGGTYTTQATCTAAVSGNGVAFTLTNAGNYTVPPTGITIAGFTATSLNVANYSSGGTPSGTGTCALGSFNNGLTGGAATMTITAGVVTTSLAITSPGYGATSAPTSATVGACTGTASATGTVTLTSTLTFATAAMATLGTTLNVTVSGTGTYTSTPVVVFPNATGSSGWFPTGTWAFQQMHLNGQLASGGTGYVAGDIYPLEENCGNIQVITAPGGVLASWFYLNQANSLICALGADTHFPKVGSIISGTGAGAGAQLNLFGWGAAYLTAVSNTNGNCMTTATQLNNYIATPGSSTPQGSTNQIYIGPSGSLAVTAVAFPASNTAGITPASFSVYDVGGAGILTDQLTGLSAIPTTVTGDPSGFTDASGAGEIAAVFTGLSTGLHEIQVCQVTSGSLYLDNLITAPAYPYTEIDGPNSWYINPVPWPGNAYAANTKAVSVAAQSAINTLNSAGFKNVHFADIVQWNNATPPVSQTFDYNRDISLNYPNYPTNNGTYTPPSGTYVQGCLEPLANGHPTNCGHAHISELVSQIIGAQPGQSSASLGFSSLAALGANPTTPTAFSWNNTGLGWGAAGINIPCGLGSSNVAWAGCAASTWSGDFLEFTQTNGAGLTGNMTFSLARTGSIKMSGTITSSSSGSNIFAGPITSALPLNAYQSANAAGSIAIQGGKTSEFGAGLQINAYTSGQTTAAVYVTGGSYPVVSGGTTCSVTFNNSSTATGSIAVSALGVPGTITMSSFGALATAAPTVITLGAPCFGTATITSTYTAIVNDWFVGMDTTSSFSIKDQVDNFIKFYLPTGTNSVSYLNSLGTGSVRFNQQASAGTGGISGGNGTTTATWSISGPGAASFASIGVASARKGTFVCTNGGTITISNTNELITSDIIISMNTAGGTITTSPAMKSVTAGTGFTVLCGATDTSTYNYDILN